MGNNGLKASVLAVSQWAKDNEATCLVLIESEDGKGIAGSIAQGDVLLIMGILNHVRWEDGGDPISAETQELAAAVQTDYADGLLFLFRDEKLWEYRIWGCIPIVCCLANAAIVQFSNHQVGVEPASAMDVTEPKIIRPTF